MNEDKGEGVAIANLIGTDGCSVVGWVYRWSIGSHAVMWDVQGPQCAHRGGADKDSNLTRTTIPI